MNVAIVTHNVVSGDGQGRVNFEIAKHLLEKGHRVTLIACRIAPELLQAPGITPVLLSDPHLPVFKKSMIFAKESRRWLDDNRHRLDIIHVNGWVTWAAADINTVHFVHSSWQKSPVHSFRIRRSLYGIKQYLYTSINAFLEKIAFRNARTIVAVSNQVRSELVCAGVSDQTIKVIFNGVDLGEYHPGSADRNALGLPIGVPLALFVGDIRSPRKNLDSVLKALVNVPELTLAVVGRVDGSSYPELANQLGINDRVVFLDYRNDVPELMRAADMFVFPSRYEACSLVLLEALASGLPVVTARTTGGAEIITPECGVAISNADDIQELTASMQRLSGDAELRERMGVSARAAAEDHSWEKMAASYISLYETMCSK